MDVQSREVTDTSQEDETKSSSLGKCINTHINMYA